MALSGAAGGVQNAMFNMLRQRMQDEAIARQVARETDARNQQQFENQRQLGADDRAQAVLDQATKNQEGMRGEQMFNIGGSVAEQLPPDAFLAQDDPAVGLLQNTGRGSLLTAKPEFKAVGPDFAGPQQDGVTPEQAAVGRPAGFLKTATAAQQKEQAAEKAKQAAELRAEKSAADQDANRTADNARADKQFSEAQRHNQAMEAKPAPTGGGVQAMAGDDVQAIADAIASGQQPPNTTGLYRNAGPVRAALAKKGYDLSTAQTDWTATQRHFATLNGAQQTRLRQATDNAYHSLDVIEELAGQWKGGKFPVLNRAQLAAAKQGVLGPQAQQIATNLDAQITDVASELGNVYMGGNSPTDHALSMAAKNLNGEWTEAQLKSAINLARRNLQIRQNSIANTGVIGASQSNPYAGQQSSGDATVPAAAPVSREFNYVPGKGLVPK